MERRGDKRRRERGRVKVEERGRSRDERGNRGEEGGGGMREGEGKREIVVKIDGWDVKMIQEGVVVFILEESDEL